MADGLERQAVFQLVEDTLAPYVGRNMARASATVHFNKAGLRGGRVTAEQLEGVLEQLAKGLRVFVGGPKTQSIVQEIREQAGLGDTG